MLCLHIDQNVFKKTAIIETGLSDHHKLIVSFFSKYFARLPPKTMNAETIKQLIQNAFFTNLIKNYLRGKSANIIMINVQLLRMCLGMY